jgi:hypothetical protein
MVGTSNQSDPEMAIDYFTNHYPLAICYIAMEAMAHRNRWFSQRHQPPFIVMSEVNSHLWMEKPWGSVEHRCLFGAWARTRLLHGIARSPGALGVLICSTSSNLGFSWDLTNKHINMLIWDDLGHSIDIVTDIHLEHNLENEHQRFTWGMCSKYPLRTPAKNIHLEQVF